MWVWVWVWVCGRVCIHIDVDNLDKLGCMEQVFAKTRVRKQENAVRDAMLAAKRIEKQLHLKFAKNGSPYEIVKAPGATTAITPQMTY